MKKILVVFGTRPEAIKMAPLVKRLLCNQKDFITKVCITAQHRQMLDQVLQVFGLEPDYDLNIMKEGQDLYDVTSNVIQGMRKILNICNPDLVLVHGDTTTAFATSLAAFYQKIEVGHVEAGLRTNNIYSPWPEEMNRQLISRIAKYHFAPTNLSKANLLKENISEKMIFVTGNTVIDALMMVKERIRKEKDFAERVIRNIQSSGYFLQNRRFILVTGHRRENFGEGFLNICNALKQIAERNQDVDIVYPVHLNPNVRNPVSKILAGIKNIYLIEPLGYEAFIYLMDQCYMVLTDSGGIQEEAPSLGKPVLVMRSDTERPEAIEAGTVKLVGTDKDSIVRETQILLEEKAEYDKMARAVNPYGDGKACQRIIDILRGILLLTIF